MNTAPVRTSIAISTLMILFTSPVVLAQSVREGDTEASVIELLGKPKGRFSTGGITMMSYGDLGFIKLTNGKVTDVALVSEQDAETAKAAREIREAARAAAEEQALRERIAAGSAEKQQILENPDFARKPAGERVAYWTGFQRRYPEVPVDAELSSARAEAARALTERNQKLRAALDIKIAATKQRIDELANSESLSRRQHYDRARELTRLRSELAAMEAQRRTL